MPGLDRRITVSVQAEGDYNDFGEFVEGATTALDVWAMRMDKTLSDVEEAGGTRDQANRAWRVRWRPEIANAAASMVSVTDGALVFNVENIIEPARTERRRFLEIEGVTST